MDSKILDAIGLNIDPVFYIIGLLVICIGLMIFDIVTRHKLKVLSRRYDKFLSGKMQRVLKIQLHQNLSR